MVSVSRAGPGTGIKTPDEIEAYRVTPGEEGYMAGHERPTLVVMWHGNGYRRDDCWIQIDEDSTCDLSSWL